jgi:hypothetical protein
MLFAGATCSRYDTASDMMFEQRHDAPKSIYLSISIFYLLSSIFYLLYLLSSIFYTNKGVFSKPETRSADKKCRQEARTNVKVVPLNWIVRCCGVGVVEQRIRSGELERFPELGSFLPFYDIRYFKSILTFNIVCALRGTM